MTEFQLNSDPASGGLSKILCWNFMSSLIFLNEIKLTLDGTFERSAISNGTGGISDLNRSFTMMEFYTVMMKF